MKQFEIVHRLSPPKPNDIGLTFLHMAAIHGLCLGESTVMPDIELRKGARFDPKKTLSQIMAYRVTCLGGAPYFIERQIDKMREANVSPSHIRLIVMGSAGVSPNLIHKIQAQLPCTDIQICYGATEAEPITETTGTAILDAFETSPPPLQLRGFYVGKPSSETRLIIVDTEHMQTVKPQTVGEVWVAGPQIIEAYTDEKVNQQRKYRDLDGTLWHRTGDRGFIDRRGGLWLVGRCGDEILWPDKANTVPLSTIHTIDPFPVENAINPKAWLKRCALIQTRPKGGFQDTVAFTKHTVLFCEPTFELTDTNKDSYLKEIRQALAPFGLENIGIQWLDQIPVDPRHFSKIDRHQLRLGRSNHSLARRIQRWITTIRNK